MADREPPGISYRTRLIANLCSDIQILGRKLISSREQF